MGVRPHRARGSPAAWARAAIDKESVDPRVRLLDVDPEGEGHAEVGSVPESEIDNPHVLVALGERLRVEALRRQA